MRDGFGMLVIAGVASTLTMDICATLARRTGWFGGVQPAHMGRWFLGILRGRLIHSDIAAAAAAKGEMPAALAGHYAIGIVLALAYGWLCAALGAAPSNVTLALGFGLATNVLPWFLMFPAMGYGVLGLKGPVASRLLRTSFANHAFYGLGLWWTSLLLLR